MVASVPVLVKRTASADGTIRQKRSAASNSAGVLAAKCDPSDITFETVETSAGCACPWIKAPNDIMKSVYWLLSTSHTWVPRPRCTTTGPGEKTVLPREGEFTPSIRTFWARSYQDCERLRRREMMVFARTGSYSDVSRTP